MTASSTITDPNAEREYRTVCLHCRRPERVCWCSHVTPIETKTRVVLLQHPRERDVPIGTARMANLSLPNSELHVGVRWSGSKALADALSDPERPAALLYPGDDAVDVLSEPPKGPITLIVVDGTWWQTRKVVRENPELAALPRLAFTPDKESEYRIRREPAPSCVSTIEALVHVLGALEGDADRFQALLAPFRAMVDMQIEHTSRLHGARVRHAKGTKHRRPNAMSRMREHASDLVCVMSEASAWPYKTKDGKRTPADELVLWSAYRLSTGEHFEEVLAPRAPLAPTTSSRIRISEDELARGLSPEELLVKWNAFVRETDVICTWGPYPTDLFTRTGGTLPTTQIDVRQVARDRVQGKVGAMTEVLESIGTPLPESLGRGRAGERLAELSAIVKEFSSGKFERR